MNMTNWSRGAAAGTIALLLMIGAPVQAADNPQVAAEIMALARAQWASEIAGESMAQQNASLAEDYTEFNGDFPTLLVGKTTSTRMGEVTPSDKAMYSACRMGACRSTATPPYSPTILPGLGAAQTARSRPRSLSRAACMSGREVGGCSSTPTSLPWPPATRTARSGRVLAGAAEGLTRPNFCNGSKADTRGTIPLVTWGPDRIARVNQLPRDRS